MSSFIDSLELRQIGPKTWEVPRDMIFYSGTKPSDEIYIVPKGTKTDGASIPRLLWRVVGHPLGEYCQAAVLHDYLYQTGIVSREKADDLLYEGMEVLGWVPKWKMKVIYWGVRLGGWIPWENHRKRNEEIN